MTLFFAVGRLCYHSRGFPRPGMSGRGVPGGFTALQVGILTVSDKGSQGQRVDTSGAALREAAVALGALVYAFSLRSRG